MISNSKEWVYLNRGSEREGLVRQWEKDCWGVLTKKGRDYNHLLYVVSAYIGTVKAVLIPGGATIAILDANDLEKSKTIEKINEQLSQNAILKSLRTKQKVEGCKIVITPKKDDGGHAHVIPVSQNRTFTTDEWDAMTRFFKDRKLSDIQYRLNTEFFPSTIEIRFVEQGKHVVLLDFNQPEAMVVQIEEIIERTNAPYEVKLVLEDIEAPMVTMDNSQENTEVA